MKVRKLFKSEFVRLRQEMFFRDFRDFDLKIQKGYLYQSKGEYDKTVKNWIDTWNELIDYMKKHKIKTLKMFDNIFNGTEFVSNWINDFDICLLTIIENSRNFEILEVYGDIRIYLNKQIQILIGSDDKLTMENAKRAIAETYFLLGDVKTSEELFETYLYENPKWGWGWIGWSDQYWISESMNPDFAKGEELLLKALDVPDLSDRECVEERLLELYSVSEQEEKLKELEKKIKCSK